MIRAGGRAVAAEDSGEVRGADAAGKAGGASDAAAAADNASDAAAAADNASDGAGPVDNTVDNTGQEKRGWRMPGPVLQGLIAFGIYLVVFVLALGQSLLPHLNVPNVGQDKQDPQIFIWALRWWPYAISHGLNPLYTSQLTQANGVSGFGLAWATTVPALSLLMSPVTVLVGPITSFNLLLLLSPPISAWGAFLLTRRLTGKFWPALLAGCVYGFNTGEMYNEMSGWLNLSITVLLPVTAYLVLLRWDGTLKRTWWYVIAMAAVLVGVFYTFDETFFDLTLAGTIAFVAGFAVARREDRRKIARLALHTVYAYAVAFVFFGPFLYYAFKHQVKTASSANSKYSLNLASLVLPRKDRVLDIVALARPASHISEPISYLGIPLLLLLIWLAVTRWSDRLVRLLAIGSVIAVLLALGPNLVFLNKTPTTLPWSFIWHLPLMKSAAPNRFMIFVYLALAVALSLWLARLTVGKVARSAQWGLGVLAVAALFGDLPTFASVTTPAPVCRQLDAAGNCPPGHEKWPQAPASWSLPLTNEIPSFFTKGTYKSYIKPGERIVVLSDRGNAGMLFQAYTGFYFNIAGGFLNSSFPTTTNDPATEPANLPGAIPSEVQNLSTLAGLVGKQRVYAFEDWVLREHIGAIVVENAWAETWSLDKFGGNYIDFKAQDIGGVTLYQVPANFTINPHVK